MERLFPSKQMTIDVRELNQIKDSVIQIQEELEHLINLLELLQEGFNQTKCLERTSEISSLHVIQSQIANLIEREFCGLIIKIEQINNVD